MADYVRAPGRLDTEAFGEPPVDHVTETIRYRFRERQKVGWKRYGVGLGRSDFTMDNWLQHFEEELMDALQYCVRVRMTISGELPVLGPHSPVVLKDGESVADQIQRLTREIGERQATLLRLVGGDPRTAVRVPTDLPVVYAHEDCTFNYCPDRQQCEPNQSCRYSRQPAVEKDSQKALSE